MKPTYSCLSWGCRNVRMPKLSACISSFWAAIMSSNAASAHNKSADRQPMPCCAGTIIHHAEIHPEWRVGSHGTRTRLFSGLCLQYQEHTETLSMMLGDPPLSEPVSCSKMSMAEALFMKPSFIRRWMKANLCTACQTGPACVCC